MTHASNVIPIGYIPSPLRNTMMSTDTGYSAGSVPSSRSHPPTQFFSADDILRASVATSRRDTQYTDRDTIYSDRDTRYSNRDSIDTTYRASIATRASFATTGYRSTAIIAPAPVPVAVRAQPKIITFGNKGSPIPAVPLLTAEKVAEAERSRATINAESSRTSNAGLNIPISIQPEISRLSTISSISSVSSTSTISTIGRPASRPPVLSNIEAIPESLVEEKSLPSTPKSPSQEVSILTPPMTDSAAKEEGDDKSKEKTN
jgi:hypothetical protein